MNRIHENGITLSETERRRLEKSSQTQDRQIVVIIRDRYPMGFTFQDIIDATGFDKDSTKRALSHMAGCDSSPKEIYQDEYGRWPLVVMPEKKLNPKSQIKVSQYQWNPRYKAPPTNQELLNKHRSKPNRQGSLL